MTATGLPTGRCLDTRPIDTRRRVRILGWKTGQTPPDAPFGMTMPKKRWLERADVPRSATSVIVLDMDAPKCKMLELKSEELDNYKLV